MLRDRLCAPQRPSQAARVLLVSLLASVGAVAGSVTPVSADPSETPPTTAVAPATGPAADPSETLPTPAETPATEPAADSVQAPPTSTVAPQPATDEPAASAADVPAPEIRANAVTALVGTFKLTGGSCVGGVSGTYFRMIQPGGTVDGPDSGYLVNADSTCTNATYTPLQPGTSGGLVTGSYQPEPNPAFDGSGNSLANSIVAPASFFGVRFSVATAATDPQTSTAVPAPSLSTDGTNLSGNLGAFSAAWNNQHFNQGAPKPDGTNPGSTGGPTGTYDATTSAFTVTWTSQIVGGPFNGFTGQWHLTGSFIPASGADPTGTTGPGTSGTAAGDTSSPAGTSSSSGSSSSLPSTGPEATLLAWLGVALVAVGAASQAWARRARRALPR